MNFGIPPAETRVVVGDGEDVFTNTADDRMLDIFLLPTVIFSWKYFQALFSNLIYPMLYS